MEKIKKIENLLGRCCDCRHKRNALSYLDDAKRYWKKFKGGAAFDYCISCAETLADLAFRETYDNPWRDQE